MRHASVLLIISIVLCSSGCAVKSEISAPAPQVVTATRCARPATPALPNVRGDVPFDHPAQVETLLTRDARLRLFIDGLNAALDCYDAQAAPREAQ